MKKINVEFQDDVAVSLHVKQISLAKLYFVLGFINGTIRQINDQVNDIRTMTDGLAKASKLIRREVENVKHG